LAILRIFSPGLLPRKWLKLRVWYAAGLLCWGLGAVQYWRLRWWPRAVILEESALYNRPYSKAQIVGSLPPGTRVELGERDAEWVQVLEPNHKQGWIHQAQASQIQYYESAP
jgi:hypothetical protein